MINSLFILDRNGKVIIEKHWRKPVPGAVDQFLKVSQLSSIPQEVPPVIATADDLYFHHILRSGLVFLTVTVEEVAPLSVLHFLHRFLDLLIDYFGAVTETTLKENFVIVYELLEELLDYGYPYITEPNILKEIVPPTTLLSTVINAVSLGTTYGTKLPSGNLSTIPWRSTGIKYTNNEIFFDIVETIDAILEKNGNVIMAETHGEILCNSRLSGMPDLYLSLLNHRMLGNKMTSFHPCVRLHRFEKDRVLSFVPPDGQFKLMDYTVDLVAANTLPLLIKPHIHIAKRSGKLNISFQPRSTGGKGIENAALSVTLPPEVTSVKLNASAGQYTFDHNTKELRWTIGKIAADFNVAGVPQLTGSLYLDADASPVQPLLTIYVDFKVNMFTATGLKIDTLQVHHEAYKPFKGVRTVTRAGRYQIRI
ncbi:adaptor complex AP-3 domain-containing protein [Fimicolochytrium jonesii]|uniref:adaptor complex AP-3 domain-containing protein n=1 Tax=Fimicolochytrium jonesii TaxID=1396493 RepID=UPI0022FEF513|nr:adaptor complex AP-3 domain-containing protein [Fimicolochytrium jonesii]KAI8824238.1 Mu homology domain-containing protein [Fimicolochytrium jonesii]